MAGQGGPDEETWKKMTPRQRRAYWSSVIIVVSFVLIMFIMSLFR